MKIAICCPNRDDFKGETVATLMVLAAQTVKATNDEPLIILPQMAFIDKSRNEALKIALNLAADCLLFVDSDISVLDNGENIISHLLNLDKDFVSGIYVDRAYPYRAHVYRFIDKWIQNIPDTPKELFKADAAGAGFMFIRKNAIEAILNQDFVAKYGLPFNFLNYGSENELREDAAFCFRMKLLKFDLWIDPSLKIFHHGKMGFTIDHWEYMKKTVRGESC